ncbi:MAG TPA: hypothetical protein VFE30_16975 [Anaeromyxobacteraceae bacterium]|jgi:hypothetical protein|nr:hypothetical protein [Anaeromyxobacteraceae bacterium]
MSAPIQESSAELREELHDVTPEEAFLFASRIALSLREHARSHRPDSQQYPLDEEDDHAGRTFAEALQRFLDAFPPAPPEHPHQALHAALARGLDPERTTAFVEWLRRGAEVAPAEREWPKAGWGYARLLADLQQIRELAQDRAT